MGSISDKCPYYSVYYGDAFDNVTYVSSVIIPAIAGTPLRAKTAFWITFCRLVDVLSRCQEAITRGRSPEGAHTCEETLYVLEGRISDGIVNFREVIQITYITVRLMTME